MDPSSDEAKEAREELAELLRPYLRKHKLANITAVTVPLTGYQGMAMVNLFSNSIEAREEKQIAATAMAHALRVIDKVESMGDTVVTVSSKEGH